MYFEIGPRQERESFFNFEEEIKQLQLCLDRGSRLTVITGPRRSGKTSLVNVVLQRRPHLTLNAMGWSAASDFVKELQSALQSFLENEKTAKNRVLEALKTVRGLQISSSKQVSISWQRKNGGLSTDIAGIFRALAKQKEKSGRSLILFVDEAQELFRLVGLDFASIMAAIYDDLPDIQMIVSGSQSGMVLKFLGIDDPKTPLFGRIFETVAMPTLSDQKAMEFLRKGFKAV